VAAAAANLAAWHDSNLAALGYATAYADGLWLTSDHVPPIFLSAIGIRPGASVAAVANRVRDGSRVAISDPWSDLDLARLGYAWSGDYPWMVRPPSEARDDIVPERPALLAFGHATDPSMRGRAPDGSPQELDIIRVTDADALDAFEYTSGIGFGSPRPRRFVWHSPSVLRDGRLRFWLGCVDGHPVAGSMSFVCAGVVGIYGVSTIPDARGRGYATAMTSAAIGADPALPAVLQPSQAAESLYRRLGFRRFASFRTWARDEPPG